jgi:hypothetical protein
MGTAGNDRRYMFNCGCKGKPPELVGRDGGVEGGFEEKETGCGFTRPPGPGPTDVGKGNDGGDSEGCEMSSSGSIFIAFMTLSSSFMDDAHRFLDS